MVSFDLKGNEFPTLSCFSMSLQQATSMNQEVATLKAKIRRLEEDNLKKEKEIDGLLHPHKVMEYFYHIYSIFWTHGCFD